MLGEFSRFTKTNKIIVDGKETYGSWQTQSWLKEKPDDAYILVFRVNNLFEGRPDLISNQVYGTPFLDWVLISFNHKYYDNEADQVLNWPKAGSIIRYPSEIIVFPEIST